MVRKIAVAIGAAAIGFPAVAMTKTETPQKIEVKRPAGGVEVQKASPGEVKLAPSKELKLAPAKGVPGETRMAPKKGPPWRAR